MTTRTQIADAFRIARQSIANNPTGFICNSLPLTTEAGKAAERIIHERMGSQSAARAGERRAVHAAVLAAPAWALAGIEPVPSRIMQAYRLRWLDALIEEFSK